MTVRASQAALLTLGKNPAKLRVSQSALLVLTKPAASPVITSIAPTGGPAAGGTAVTITGVNLTGTTNVRFGGVNATSIVVVNSTTVTCVTPSGTGTVDVDLYNPGGNYNYPASFTYAAAVPRITQVPILIIDKPNEPNRLTQLPLLVLYQELQPSRVTQVPIEILYEPKPVPLPQPVIPEMPLIETWEWLTVISQAQNSQEQRVRLRDVPRYRLNMSALILDENDRRAIYNMLMRYLKTIFVYPLYHYNVQMKQAASIGDTKLFVTTAISDFRAGEKAAVFDPELQAVNYVDITTVDSDGINLAAPLAFDVPIYWQACPAFNFRITPVVGLNMRNIAGDFSIVMESTHPRVFQRPGAAPTLTTVDGLLVIPERPLANDNVPENFDFGVTWFDNKTSIPDNLNAWNNPQVKSKLAFSFDRKTKIDYWRAIIDTLKGRQNVALFPTFRNDLPLRDPVALNVTQFTTNNIDFFIWWLDLNYKYIAINTTNGMKYRKIISVDPHYNANGDPDYLIITLATSIGNVAGDNEISSISYMNLYRLDDDTIKLTHYDLETEIELSIKAVDK